MKRKERGGKKKQEMTGRLGTYQLITAWPVTGNSHRKSMQTEKSGEGNRNI